MKAFITGASGFIGRYLVDELLAHHYEVIGLSRNPDTSISGAEIITGDITKPETFSSALKDVDLVFHNAALAKDYGGKKQYTQVNVLGTKKVADACIKQGINRLIYTSSAGVYGFPKDNEIITEESKKNPLNNYQKTKYEGELVLKNYQDLHVSAIRPPLVFGPGSPALQIAFHNLKEGKMMYIGSGNQEITIAHPVDVARCLRLIAEKDKKGTVFNVASFICSIKDFMEEVSQKSGIDPPKRHVPFALAYSVAWFSELFNKDPSLTRFRVKSLGTTRRISAEKAAQHLGYNPTYDFSKTVNEIADWYQSHLA